MRKNRGHKSYKTVPLNLTILPFYNPTLFYISPNSFNSVFILFSFIIIPSVPHEIYNIFFHFSLFFFISFLFPFCFLTYFPFLTLHFYLTPLILLYFQIISYSFSSLLWNLSSPFLCLSLSPSLPSSNFCSKYMIKGVSSKS